VRSQYSSWRSRATTRGLRRLLPPPQPFLSRSYLAGCQEKSRAFVVRVHCTYTQTHVGRKNHMTLLQRTRLEKAAADCGFDLSPQWEGDALRMRSNQFPETVLVRGLSDDEFEVLASNPVLLPREVPKNKALVVSGWKHLYGVLDAASACARTLPNRVAQRFKTVTAHMPKSTEAERLVVQRVGQNLFRDALLEFWNGKCCVTGLAMPALLRASHMRPWAKCETDEQRLDVFNGLLLSPNLDALFDDGWITFRDDGGVVLSNDFNETAQKVLSVSSSLFAKGLRPEHNLYLEFHRSHVFKGASYE
jgi:putative restriction endonuclease